MKCKLISVFLIGLLTAGLYAEAAVSDDISGADCAIGISDAIENESGTETEDITETGDITENGDMAGNENSEYTPKEEEPTELEGKQTLPVFAGGIWADLKSAEGVPAGQAAPGGTESGSGSPEQPEGVDSPAEENRQEDETENETENEYADLAIADVRNYVNVRTGPDTGSSIVGKIYDGAVAQILETVDGEAGEWFHVVSGNVEGYIKSEFFLYGDAAAEVIDDYVTRYAVVLANRLNVRESPDVETKRIGYINKGERARILENLGDWLKVQYTRSKTGYVAAEYVTVTEEFVYAKTLEEEAAELAEKEALEQRQNVSETQAAESTEITVTPPAGEYSTNEELRSEIVAYAMQFLGNRYVHGGQSLETGTDCSGFTSLIYAVFGYSVSRTPAGQLSGAGRDVSYSEAQPGDIICYGSSRCTHVALYIGDGQIIHAANSRKGVVTQRADYDNILGVKNLID